MKVIDLNGKWYMNTGLYAFNDPESSTVMEPGVLMKVTETAWLKSQPVMVAQPDPAIPAVKIDKPVKK